MVWGVLGGMGPLASAEFINTIYATAASAQEQDAPVVHLYSDPRFPDRTEALARGETHPLLWPLVESLEALRSLGASRLILCCITMHQLIPSLPKQIGEAVVSLVDLVLDEIRGNRNRYVVICSAGTRAGRLFEGHPLFSDLRDRIVFPCPEDQERIHQIIYAVKRNSVHQDQTEFLRKLIRKAAVDSIVAACTEIHVILQRTQSAGLGPVIDPLRIMADRIAGSTRAFHGRPAGLGGAA